MLNIKFYSSLRRPDFHVQVAEIHPITSFAVLTRALTLSGTLPWDLTNHMYVIRFKTLYFLVEHVKKGERLLAACKMG